VRRGPAVRGPVTAKSARLQPSPAWDPFPASPARRSIAVNGLAPVSSGVSNVGGGPIAEAAAGEAVAMSKADDPENDRGTAN
jgi:hypothetical protein